MVKTSNLLTAAKQIGTYSFVIFSAYFMAIVLTIIGGYLEEKVITQLGLNVSGNAYNQVTTFLTGLNAAIAVILGIFTVITGLLTLNVVLTAFGIKLNFKMGMNRV